MQRKSKIKSLEIDMAFEQALLKLNAGYKCLPLCVLSNYTIFKTIRSIVFSEYIKLQLLLYSFCLMQTGDEALNKHLSYICSEEEVEYEEGTLQCLINTCEGDLRKAITSLQSVSRLNTSEKISKKDIYEITGKE